MAGDTKRSQKTLEQKGYASLAMNYPEEMGIIAVAKDMTERVGETITPDMVLGFRQRLKAGSAYREALLQVERADLRFKLKTLAHDMRDIFEATSGEADFMRAKAYAGHTLAGVYKQLYESLGDEIQRVKAESLGEEGEEKDADFTLVPEEEPQPLPAPGKEAAPAPAAQESPAPAPVPATAAEDDDPDTMGLLQRL